MARKVPIDKIAERAEKYKPKERVTYKQTQRKIEIGSLVIDMEASRVYKGDSEIGLTAREYGLLVHLAENPDKIISKERLYEQVVTVKGLGYKLVKNYA